MPKAADRSAAFPAAAAAGALYRCPPKRPRPAAAAGGGVNEPEPRPRPAEAAEMMSKQSFRGCWQVVSYLLNTLKIRENMGTRYLVVIKHEGLQFRFSTFSQLVLERRTVRKWCQVTNYSVFVFCLHKSLMLRLSFLAPVNSTLLLYIYQLFQAYVY